jgi:hypothetical protein
MKSRTEMHQRRTLLLGLGATVLAPLAGCISKPLQPINADGTYCHRIGRGLGRKLTCTPTAVPTDSEEAQAKRFDADPDSLSVYVLRRRWGDAGVVVPVLVDGAAAASTIPESLVRLRLRPGTHRLTAQWQGQALDVVIQGRAGDLRVVELVGAGWAWGSSFRWEPVQAEGVKSRAQASKLVADLDFRHLGALAQHGTP